MTPAETRPGRPSPAPPPSMDWGPANGGRSLADRSVACQPIPGPAYGGHNGSAEELGGSLARPFDSRSAVCSCGRQFRIRGTATH